MHLKISLGMIVAVTALLPLTATADFSDLENDHRFYQAVTSLKESGQVKGNPDGTFRPDATINRAEFTKIVSTLTVFPGMEQSCIETNVPSGAETVFFPDVPADAWFAPFVCQAKMNDFIQGYPDGTFRPDQPIEFAEAAKIIAKVLKLDYEEDSKIWYAPFVAVLNQHGAIPETIDVPHKFITRGEMAGIIYQLAGNQREAFYSFETKTQAEETETSIIDIKYPEFFWNLRDRADNQEKFAATAFNAEIKKIINSEIISYEAYDIEEVFGETKNSLYITYTPVFMGGGDIVSIRFNVSIYSGGAHPNSHSTTLTFDLKEGREITLEDLFLPGAEYLDGLSKASNEAVINYYKWLGEDPDTDWVATGTEPDELSFKSFNLKPTGIELTFDPYHVGPYAAGTIIVTIPYSHPAIKDLIDDEGPVATIMK